MARTNVDNTTAASVKEVEMIAKLSEHDAALDALEGVVSPAEPPEVTGARDTPEEALANLLTVLDGLGIILDSTTET